VRTVRGVKMQNVSKATSVLLLCLVSTVKSILTTGAAAGPSRLLCKYQNCTNPTCAFRHEDANGNTISAPALRTKTKQAPEPASSDEGDVEIVGTSGRAMDGVLDETRGAKPCRFGDRCTKGE
jgi:hypothetical protein